MRIKSLLLVLVLCMLTLFASCNTSKEAKNKNIKQKSTTQSTIKNDLTKEEIDIKWRNYYNHYIAEDKQYIYYVDAYGVNKISKSNNKVVKLTDKDLSKTNLGFFLAKHNSFIYYVTSQGLCRIGTNGQNYYKFKNIPTSNSIIKCVNDKLYVYFSFSTKNNYNCDHIIYCYNIKDDPKIPKLITKDAGNIPSPDGKIYYLKTIGEGPDGILYSYNINCKNKKEVLCNITELITYENNFYYSDTEGKIFRCNKDGKNPEKLFESHNPMLRLISYDGEWIYMCEHELEGLKFSRLNINTNEVQSLKKIDEYDTTYFDVTDKYIYFAEKGKMKYIKNDGTGTACFVK